MAFFFLVLIKKYLLAIFELWDFILAAMIFSEYLQSFMVN